MKCYSIRNKLDEPGSNLAIDNRTDACRSIETRCRVGGDGDREILERIGRSNQAQMWHPRRLGDSLQGDELQVVKVNHSRLDMKLPV